MSEMSYPLRPLEARGRRLRIGDSVRVVGDSVWLEPSLLARRRVGAKPRHNRRRKRT